ncbi:MAG: Threonine--tRNA ligase [Methanocella sp. PtaU1.Bin125]|nr:MAG: Threonine--tRNA ligase [Methanocella sp. PtaU1.Bin125]
MRIVAIHADRISYRANRRTKIAEEIEAKEDAMEDCVVLLCSVEKLDERNPRLVIAAAVGEVTDRLKLLKASRVLIFPFAHLTPALGAPDVALALLKGLAARLKEAGVEVKRAPFGWYKEYEIKSKGHPLAELSMVICPYEGRACDYKCPYCENPVRLQDIKDLNAQGDGRAETVKAGTVPAPERV